MLMAKLRISGIYTGLRSLAGRTAEWFRYRGIGRKMAGWRRRLEEVSRSLSSSISDKEPAFLEIGEQLQGFSSRSRELSRRAEELTKTASGKEMQQALERLETSLGELRRLRSEEDSFTQRLRGAFEGLIGEILKLCRQMEQFPPMIKHLRMLSLYIRIESARMGSQGESFVNLAVQVEDLAGNTEKQVEDMDRQAGRALENVRGAASWIKASTGRSGAEGLLEGIENSSREFYTLQERAGRISSNLDERTRAIVSDIGEVVSSVQFHDITRQQVEHVSQVLSEAASMIREDSMDRREIAGWLEDVCSLEERQLASASGEFSQAMSRIRESLSGIAAKVEGLEAEASSITAADGSDGSTMLERIRQRVEGLVGPMRETLDAWAEVRDTMDRTEGQVRSMESFMDQVEAISEEIKRIALNASIQADRTGQQGESMGVVAEAVRKMSRDAGELTRQTGGHLEEITRHSDSLRSGAEELRELSGRESSLITGLEELVENLQSREGEMTDCLAWLGRESRDLASAIQQRDEGRELVEQVEAELGEARKSLQNVQEESQKYVKGEKKDHSVRSQRLQEILQRYTMESERLVHMAFAGLEQEDSSPPGEQQAKDSSDPAGSREPEEAGETETEDEDLGDNVELF